MTLSHGDAMELFAGFVLGSLTPEEEAAVRDHLASCPESHEELAALGGVVPYLADALEPVEPPASLRARLLAVAAAERTPAAAERTPAASQEVAPAQPAIATPAPAPIPFPSAAERMARAQRRTSPVAWALRIAAVLAIVALGAWNLQLNGRLATMETDLQAARAYQDGVAAVLHVATQDGARTAFIRANPDAPTTASGVAAAGPDGTVVLSMRNLAPTSGAQVYEAWVIGADGTPVPLGGFTVGGSGTGIFHGSTPLATPGAVLALTLEPGPGATAPTLPVLTTGVLADSGT